MTECNLIIATEQRFQHGFFLILCKSLTVACNSDLDCSVLCLLCLHDSHQAFCCSYSSIHKTLIDYCYRMRSMLPVLLLKISLQCSFTAESALKQLLRLYFSSGAMTKILHNVWFFFTVFHFFLNFLPFFFCEMWKNLGFAVSLLLWELWEMICDTERLLWTCAILKVWRQLGTVLILKNGSSCCMCYYKLTLALIDVEW